MGLVAQSPQLKNQVIPEGMQAVAVTKTIYNLLNLTRNLTKTSLAHFYTGLGFWVVARSLLSEPNKGKPASIEFFFLFNVHQVKILNK